MFLNPPCFLFVRQQKGSKKCLKVSLIPPAFRQRAPRYRLRPARQSSASFLEDATSYQVKDKKRIALTNLGKHLISLNKKRLSAK